MPRQRKQVTAAWLRSRDRDLYCPDAYEAFVLAWGKSGKPTVEQCVRWCWKRGRGDWSVWLLDTLLPNDLRCTWMQKPETRRVDMAYAKKLMKL